MNCSFQEVLTTRRSIYTLGNKPVISPQEAEALVRLAIVHTPSAFNSQPGRAVILHGAEHQVLWKIVWETLQESTPVGSLSKTKAKLDGFAAGLGTILFYIDEDVVRALEEQFPTYQANFSPWAEQANGMLQYVVWGLLHDAGLGVNLQHYNPLIDERVAKQWEIPQPWRLIGQMVFGSVEAPAAFKQPIDPEDKVRLVL